ncbi:hypothetical protein MMC25_001063 [Agyrium rufum]|nr:hypothetical protein [Agyrium rufum]
MAGLIVLAEDAQDIAAAFNKFLEPVSDQAVDITGLIAELFLISSTARDFHSALLDPRYERRKDLVVDDYRIIAASLGCTLKDINRLFGDLNRPIYLTKRDAYRSIWREIASYFRSENSDGLLARLRWYKRFMTDLKEIVQGFGAGRDTSALRLEIEEILRLLAQDLSSAPSATPTEDPWARLSFRSSLDSPQGRPRRIPSPSPEPVTSRRRRRDPLSPTSPLFEADYDFPPAPEPPLSPTMTSTTTSTRSSERSLVAGKHWLPAVFNSGRSTTEFSMHGPASACYGPDMPDASRKLRAEYENLSDLSPEEDFKMQDEYTPISSLQDDKLKDEKLEFSAAILDDNYEHVLRVWQDKNSGGIRLQASVLTGVKKKMPVWTAFITYQIHSHHWIIFNAPASIELRELQRYIFTEDYSPQLGPHGGHELSFMEVSGWFLPGERHLKQNPEELMVQQTPINLWILLSISEKRVQPD